MNKKAFPLIVLLSLLFVSCSALFQSGRHDGFVKVLGSRFVLDGKPYYYGGTNLWYGCYIGSSGETGNRERLKRELDNLKSQGLVNLRLLAASEDSYLLRSVKPAIQTGPGRIDEALLDGLDFLLAEMAERDMRAVLYLNNYWEWSGGMAAYNAWANGASGPDPEDPSQGWSAFMNFSATFYANDKANRLYRDYVRRIVTRRNTFNGRNYAQDPTIMSWQLANEPRPGTESPEGEKNVDAFCRWIDETAAYIHALDTNHLVSTGSEGTVGTLRSPDVFVRSHRTPNVDYLTCHLWPLNWGWFDPKKFTETLPKTEENALEYINIHLALARTLNKPIVMEEFGIGRDSGFTQSGTPTTARDHYYQRILGAAYDSARAGAPYAGSNFWAWGGEGRGRAPGSFWQRGDAFVGDPPQEGQGLNSIFDTDSSTLRILRDHAFKMMQLRAGDSLVAALARERGSFTTH
jgi:mannan endo-1,4-beta-mannosidase